MSQFDDEHGIGPRCTKCGMDGCESAKGCTKRQTQKRHRDEVDTLRARVAELEAERAAIFAEIPANTNGDSDLPGEVRHLTKRVAELEAQVKTLTDERDAALTLADAHQAAHAAEIVAHLATRREAGEQASGLVEQQHRAHVAEARAANARREADRLREALEMTPCMETPVEPPKTPDDVWFGCRAEMPTDPDAWCPRCAALANTSEPTKPAFPEAPHEDSPEAHRAPFIPESAPCASCVRLREALVETHEHVKVIYSHYSLLEIANAVKSESGSQLYHYGKALRILVSALAAAPEETRR